MLYQIKNAICITVTFIIFRYVLKQMFLLHMYFVTAYTPNPAAVSPFEVFCT